MDIEKYIEDTKVLLKVLEKEYQERYKKNMFFENTRSNEYGLKIREILEQKIKDLNLPMIKIISIDFKGVYHLPYIDGCVELDNGEKFLRFLFSYDFENKDWKLSFQKFRGYFEDLISLDLSLEDFSKNVKNLEYCTNILLKLKNISFKEIEDLVNCREVQDFLENRKELHNLRDKAENLTEFLKSLKTI